MISLKQESQSLVVDAKEIVSEISNARAKKLIAQICKRYAELYCDLLKKEEKEK